MRPMGLITNLVNFSADFAQGELVWDLLRVLSIEGVYVGVVDLSDALAHDIKEEFGVVGALLGGDHVVHRYRTQELGILLCERG